MKLNKKIFLFLFFVFTAAFLIRIVQLESVPAGFMNDETAISYNAWLISKTGKDEWGRLLPLSFRSFGDWKLPVYIYILSLVYQLAPLSIFWTRVVSAFFGSLTIVFLYFLVLQLFKDDKKRYLIAFLSSLLLIFNPWHIGLSRTASEANLGLFFFVTALYFYFKYSSLGIKKHLKIKKNYKFLIISIVFSILSFYSYHVFRFLIPGVIVYIYLFSNKKFINKSKKNILSLIKIISLIVILSVFAVFLSKQNVIIRLKQINIFSKTGIVDQVNEFRGLCLTRLPFGICRLVYNKPVFWAKEFLFNYFNHLSPQFLFFPQFEKGYQILPHSSYFYFLIIPFLVLGVFKFFKNGSLKNKNLGLLLFLLFITPIPSSLTDKGHFVRPYPIVLPIIIFTALGVSDFINFLGKKAKAWTVVLGISYCFVVTEFLVSYFTSFPVKQAVYSHYEYKPLFEYLQTVDSEYDHIYISNVNHDSKQYVYYLFYSKIEPNDYFSLNKDIEIEENGWVWAKQLGKYNFIRGVDRLDNYPDSSLLVVDPQGIKNFPKPKKIIKYPNGNTAFNVYDLDEVKKEYIEK